MKKRITALVCAISMSAGLLAGCGGSSTNATASQPTEGTETTKQETVGSDNLSKESQTGLEGAFTEAPGLAALVAAGSLPAVSERLPDAAEVMVEYMDSIGTYGEAMNSTFTGSGQRWWYGKMTEEPLFRFKEDGTIEPNVAKGYDVNDDATLYTIYLRSGMKWSDGVDFTADDCIFFYDKMCVPATFGRATLYECFMVTDPESGEQSPCTFAKVDDYTFTVTFDHPKPLFLEEVAINAKWCFAPSHWMKTVLPEFIGEEAAEALATEMGYSDVAAMGKDTGYYYWNIPGRPMLRPWIIEADSANGNPDGEYFVMTRNPYYWKVDETGQQLPYLDEFRLTKVSDESQMLLKILDGSSDFRNMNYTDYSVLYENKEKGGYELLEWNNIQWSATVAELQLNQTIQDEKLRDLYQNKDFRQALSIAVDRVEYTELISDGFANPTQASPQEGQMGYSEEWANKWTEYDPEGAKVLLEACGLVMGSDGYWKFADGSDFVLNIQTYTEKSGDRENIDKSAELLVKYYGEVGIETTYKAYERSLFENMLKSNEHQAVLGPLAPASPFNLALRPETIVPLRNYAAWYGAVGDWYEYGGKSGVAPTGDLAELCDLYYNKLKTAITPEEREEISLAMLKLHEENIWIIGYMSMTPTLYAKKTNLKNFYETSVWCDEFRELGLSHPATWYFAE